MDGIDKLYQGLSAVYDLGTPEDFRAKIADEQHRKNLYDQIIGTVDLGVADYNEFSKKVNSYIQPRHEFPNLPDISNPIPTFGNDATRQDQTRMQDYETRIPEEVKQHNAAVERRMEELQPQHEAMWAQDRPLIDEIYQQAQKDANDEYMRAAREYSVMPINVNGGEISNAMNMERRANEKRDPAKLIAAFNNRLDERMKERFPEMKDTAPASDSDLAFQLGKTPEDYQLYKDYVMRQLQQYFTDVNMPKSQLEYFARKVIQGNILGQLYEIGTKPLAQRQFEMQGLQQYASQNNTTGADIGAEVTNVVTDPLMWIMPGVGGLAGKAVVGRAGRKLFQHGLTDAAGAAERAAMQRGILRTAKGLTSGGVMMAGIDTGHTLVGQLYQSGEVEWKEVGKSALRGAATGVAFGTMPFLGERVQKVIGDAYGRSVGLVAGRAAQFTAGTNIMVGSSVLSHLMNGGSLEDVDWGSEYAHAAAMQLFFDVQGGLKTAINAKGFGNAWRLMKQDPTRYNLTKEEIEQFNAAGIEGKDAYNILKNLNGGKDFTSVDEYYKVLNDISANENIDTQAKYKLASLLYGKVDANLRPIYVTDVIQDEQGRYVVRTFDNGGMPYETKYFTSEAKAEEYRQKQYDETRNNLRTWQEGVVSNYQFAQDLQDVADEAILEIQKQYPQYSKEQLYSIMREALLNPKAKSGRAIAQSTEADAIRGMFEEYLASKSKTPAFFNILSAVRAQAASDSGISAKELGGIISRDYSNLDYKERGIYDNYLRRLAEAMPNPTSESTHIAGELEAGGPEDYYAASQQPPVQPSREDLIRQEVTNEVASQMHNNGYVYPVKQVGVDGKAGFIVGNGEVVVDTTNPERPRISNDDIVTVKYEDGTVEQVSARTLDLLSTPEPVDNIINSMVEQRLAAEAQQAVAEQAAQNLPEGVVEFTNGEQNLLVKDNGDGTYLLLNSDGTLNVNSITAKQLADQGYAMIPIEEAPQAPVQQVQEQPVVQEPQQPAAPAQPAQPAQPAEPQEPDFNALSAGDYAAAAVEHMGSRERVAKFLEMEIKAAENQLRAAEKKTVTHYNGMADFNRQQDLIDQEIQALQQRVAKLKEAKDKAASYLTIAEREQMAKTEAERQAREEAARIAREQAAAEEAARLEQERIDRELKKGVPDFSEDNDKDARARGFHVQNGYVIHRQKPLTPIAIGKPVMVQFAKGKNGEAEAVNVLINISELQPSHINGQRNPAFFVSEMQPKDRRDQVSKVTAQEAAQNIHPMEIIGGATAYVGSPVVLSTGEVVQGNWRGNVLIEMYRNYPESVAKYKQALIDNAASLNFTEEDIERIKNEDVISVRMLKDLPIEQAIQLGQKKATDLETGGVQLIDPQVTATQLGDKIQRFADTLLKSDDEEASLADLTLRNGKPALEFLQRLNIISPAQMQSAFDSRGNMTAETKAALQGVLKQVLFKDAKSDNLPIMFDDIPLTAQKAILQTIVRDIQTENPDSKLTPHIQEAIGALYRAIHQSVEVKNSRNEQETRAAMQSWAIQMQFPSDFDAENFVPSEIFSNFALELATLFKYGKQTEVASKLNSFYNAVQGQTGGLFGDTPAIPFNEAVKAFFGIDYKAVDLRASATTSESEAEKTARLQAEHRQQLTDYLSTIADEGHPFELYGNDNVIELLKELGANEWTLARAQEVIDSGQAIQGIKGKGRLLLNSDVLDTEEIARSKYVHERQHLLTTPEQIKRVLQATKIEDLKGIVRILAEDTDFYDKAGESEIAEEFISFGMEEAYKVDTDEELENALKAVGANDELINIIKDINNEQRANDERLGQGQRLGKARRNPNDHSNPQRHSEQSGRDKRQESGVLEPKGTRPDTRSELGGRTGGENQGGTNGAGLPEVSSKSVAGEAAGESGTPKPNANSNQKSAGVGQERGLGEITPFKDTLLGRVVSDFKKQYQDENVGILFREGDTYELYDEDAVKAGQILGLETTTQNGVPFLSFPKDSLKSYLSQLVRGGLKIGISSKPDHKPSKGDYQIGDKFTWDGKEATIQDFTYFGTAIIDVDGSRREVSREQLDDILDYGDYMYHVGEVVEYNGKRAQIVEFASGDPVIQVEGESENRYVSFSDIKRIKKSEVAQTTNRGSSNDQSRNLTDAAEVETGGALVDQLERMGVDVSTDLAANQEALKKAKKDKSEEGKIHYYKTQSGKQYGFSYKGKVYLDPRKVDANLPLHEYGHLWCDAFRRLNPEGWQSVIETIKADADSWNFIKQLRPELKTDDEIADEVIATFSGERGAQKLREELERMADKDPNYKSKWQNIFKNISKAIQDFWKAVGDFLNIKYQSAEQIYDQVLKDFVDNMNPYQKVRDFLRARDAEYIQAAESGDIQKATNIFYDALRENIGNGITPYMSVGTYLQFKRLAKGVKTRDAAIIREAAEKIAPLIPDNAVLVPTPSHTGRATDMLDLANAIAEITGSEVADILRSAPRESQYQAKKETGTPIASQQLGIMMEGTVPADKTAIVIDNVVDSGNTAEACIQALGKGVVVTLADSAEQYRHAASLRSAAPILRDKDGKIVPLTKRFNLNGSRYLGRRMYLRPNDPRFAISGTQVIPVGEKTLVGLHNISAEKLRKVMKAGGLANPSAAVIDIAKQDHHDYGEVSLVLPSSLIEKADGTYSGDAWTPMYPPVEYRAGKDTEKRIKALTKGLPDNLASAIALRIRDYMDGNSRNSGMEYLFLKEQGRELPIEHTPRRYPYISIKQIADRLGIAEPEYWSSDVYQAYEQLPEDQLFDFNLWLEQNGNQEEIDKRKAMVERWRSEGKDAFANTWVGRQSERMSFAAFDSAGYRILRDERDAGEENTGMTLDKASYIVDTEGLRPEFETWLQQKIDGLGYEEVLFGGYTPSGNRRWLPNTVENASKLMNQKSQTNYLERESVNETKAMLMEKFRTLAQIRKHRDILEPDREKIKAAYEAVSSDWNQLGIDFRDYTQTDKRAYQLDDNPFIAIDTALARIQEAMFKADPIAFLNREYRYSLPADSEFGTRIKEIKERIKNLPSRYFETKFRRPVYLNEFANAVVPNDLPQDLRAGLESAGLRLFSYNPNAQGSRRDATLEATAGEGIRFSISSAKGSPSVARRGNLQYSEGVLPSVAKEMESIKNNALNDGTFMKAPNGKPTNLDERQWLQVRTRAFKRWFGDWENDPENASKVLDVNGEPMVVYHGRSPIATFTEFRPSPFGSLGAGIYFAPDRSSAEAYSRRYGGEYGKENVIEAFLNMRNPLYTKGQFLSDAERAELENHDGVIFQYYGDIIEINAHAPNQIKSATDNDGSFSEENDDIRFAISNQNNDIFYSNAERAVEGIKQEKATPEQWRAMIEKAGGLKAGEDKWIGLSDWLAQQRPTVTPQANETRSQFVERAAAENKRFTLSKQDLLDYIRDHKIQIEETEYADELSAAAQERLEALNAEFQDLMAQADAMENSSLYLSDDAEWAYNEMKNSYGDDFEMAFEWQEEDGEYKLVPKEDWYNGGISDAALYYLGDGSKPINETRKDYTTEGLENKREIALTVPTIESWNEDDEIHFGDAGEGRAIAWVRFGDAEIIEKRDELEQAEKNYGDFIRSMVAKYGNYYERVMSDSEHDRYYELGQALASARRTSPTTKSKVLVIDEIQSKRHQEGREHGYVDSETAIKYRQLEKEVSKAQLEYHDYRDQLWKKYENQVRTRGEMLDVLTHEEKSKHTELQEKYENLYDRWEEFKKNIPVSAIPAAPFEKNWHELAMKRILRFAAENGYDKVAWTTGDQQAARYDIGKVVDMIEFSDWIPADAEDNDYGVEYRKVVIHPRNQMDMWYYVDRNGNLINQDEGDPNTLAELVGKDLARNIVESSIGNQIGGEGLRIGGEGMRGFYDDILPRFMQKYGKKWGVQVGEVTMPQLEDGYQTMHAIDINDAMRESVLEGQPMFSISGRGVNGTMKPQEGETRSQYIARVAETVKNMTPRNTTIDDAIRFSITVNHNSPYLLKRADGSFVDPETGERLGFDHRFMGKGEGGQAHGWGSYFSVNDIRSYGEGYGFSLRDIKDAFNTSRWQSFGVGDAFDVAKGYLLEAHSEKAPSLRKWLEDRLAQKQELLKNYEGKVANTAEEELMVFRAEADVQYIPALLRDMVNDIDTRNRHHYTVEIPDNDGTNYLEEGKAPKRALRKMLKAMTDEQKERIASIPVATYTTGEEIFPKSDLESRILWLINQTGWRDLYEVAEIATGSQQAASELLSKAGFVGIHYDGRRDGECYVIFNPDDAIITDHIRFSVTGSENANKRNSTFTGNESDFDDQRKLPSATNEMDDQIRFSVKYDPRSSVPKVRGGWTKEKILRYLKQNAAMAGTGKGMASRLISEFDSPAELKDHMFYHGTVYGPAALKPSITMSERDAERYGGGGYGDRYWGISLTKDKKIASNFSGTSRSVKIYPVILAKNANVIERPDFSDAYDLEDHIVELWEQGVDAVWIGEGKQGKGEQELCVLNPRAICVIERADWYDVYNMANRITPLKIVDDEHIEKMYNAALEYQQRKYDKPRYKGHYPMSDEFKVWEIGITPEERAKRRAEYEAALQEYRDGKREFENTEEAKAWRDYEREVDDTIRFSVSNPSTLSRSETVTKALVQQANNNYNIMQSALKKVTADLKGIRAAMRMQSDYDRKVVDALLNLYNTLLQENGVWAQYMPDTTRRIATQIVHAIGKQNITEEVNTIMDHMVHAQAKAAQRQWDKLRTTPVDKINISGVVMQGKVALQGQHALKAMNDALQANLTIEQIEEQINQLMDMEDNATDESLKTQYKGQWIGLTIAAQHLERLQHLQEERQQLDLELQSARSNKALKPAARQQLVNNIKQAMRDNYIEQAEAYTRSTQDLSEYVNTQEGRAKDFIRRQDANRDKIRSYAQRDLEGLATNPNRNRTRGNVARSIRDAFASPIRDLQSLLRLTGLHAPDGEGYLYNHFMRNWMDGADMERTGIVAASKTLDEKIAELTHGKYKTWEEAARKINDASHNMFGITMLNGVDGKDMPVTEEIPLNAGNALYIYAVNKMNDGRMKLNGMNITEEDVQALADKVRELFGQEILDVVDWVQSEFFSQLRNRYNPTHEALFGAPMDAIENYFPLRINANARQQNEDLSEPDTDAARLLAGTSTGAIKRRTRNSLPLDVRNADFFQEVIRHISQMERWNAFAQWNRDANILFSDINFRNRIKGMKGTIYGEGDKLYNYMKDAFRVAIGTYKPNADGFSKEILNAAKGVTSAKINFRVFTALKQIASFPAFFTYMQDGTFVTSYLRNWLTPHSTMKWAKENLPNFEKRVSKRDLGDMRLMSRSTDWQWNKRILEWSSKYGMFFNVFFDTLTCATGARAVYDSHLADYLKKGYSEEDARNRARQDAELAFNTSQQSSEGAFMAPIQMDRNAVTAALTVFRTSPMQYTRNFFFHVRGLLRKIGEGKRDEQIAFRMGQYKNDGLNDEQARKAAEKDYNKSIRADVTGVVVYGALLGILWRLVGSFPYLFFGDDDDKKKQIVMDAVTGGAFVQPITGLIGGSYIESALDGNGLISSMFAPELPFTQDAKRAEQYLQNNKYAEFASQALSVLMQSTTGFDPLTASDMVSRIVTTLDSEEELEAATQALRVSQALLSIPQSQYEQMLIDKVVSGETDEDAALEDYIRYQKIHTAPLTWWLRGEESDEKAEENAEKRFNKLLTERDKIKNPEDYEE